MWHQTQGESAQNACQATLGSCKVIVTTQGTTEMCEGIQDMTYGVASGRCWDYAFLVLAKQSWVELVTFAHISALVSQRHFKDTNVSFVSWSVGLKHTTSQRSHGNFILSNQFLQHYKGLFPDTETWDSENPKSMAGSCVFPYSLLSPYMIHSLWVELRGACSAFPL